MTQAAWFLLHCKSRQESRAETHLANQGYVCFLPRIEKETLHHGQRLAVPIPLFPGYLFVYLDPQVDNWSPLRSTRGVTRLVSFGAEPLPVPNELIATLQQRVAETPTTPVLRPGDRLRVTEGVFADIEGIFNAWDDHERVVILLNLMQREHRLILSSRSVQKLPAA